MRSKTLISISLVCICGAGTAHASQTVNYTYDALGRLTGVSIAGGPGNGISQSYQYDATGNRSQQTVSAPGQTTVSLSVPVTTVNVTSSGVTLTVDVSGSAPGGTITLTENGVFLGIASVIGGQASISLEGIASGSHSIRATYSGDGTFAPNVGTFSINIHDLRWLPAVLQLLLGD
jgi:hypothetical protein